MIAILIIMIALFIAMFKLLWELINAYITILVTTILSPLIILMSSFPGKSSGLDNWWKTLLANALIFPAVFGAFLFAGLFLANSSPTEFQTTLPLFDGLPVQLFRTLLGYGIMLATPGIPKLVKEAFKVKDNPLGSVAQAGFTAGIGVLGGAKDRGYSTAMKGLGLEEARAGAERRRLERISAGGLTPRGLGFFESDNPLRHFIPKPKG